MTPQIPKDRRQNDQTLPPTMMMQAVKKTEKWKLNILFIVGVLGFIGLVVWFMLHGEEGHKHTVIEVAFAGGAAFVCAFFAFPLGIMRMIDKMPLPGFLRRDRRNGKNGV